MFLNCATKLGECLLLSVPILIVKHQEQKEVSKIQNDNSKL